MEENRQKAVECSKKVAKGRQLADTGTHTGTGAGTRTGGTGTRGSGARCCGIRRLTLSYQWLMTAECLMTTKATS